ncbi:MAG: 1-deoxy-D-xylulose-5-phosphate reductoisomerase [Sulfuricurvum sp.]|nr:1-deoxy-D-xylulose-5-phosphate reductoisomerase [Sulfuricurvum sp.]
MILLGSTGSIGVNALAIARQFGLRVDVLVAGRNIALLNQQIRIHNPSIVIVADGVNISSVNHPCVLHGEAAILDVIASSSASLVINALVGFAGLRPTLKAIESGKRVALANKESLVAAGAFMDISKIQPIDSEHFGLWYLNNTSRPIERMLITASGGAFRDWPIEKIQEATLQDTLNHPNWSMGQKITIDSASMMNKMFELLEARWLFGDGEYDAVIETKSIIHALIDYKDGSTTAHFARADMQLPIAYALMGQTQAKILPSVNLLEVGSLEFREITAQRYPIWEIRKELLLNPKRGVVVNAANEAAIELFVAGKIGFQDISKQVIHAFEHFDEEPKNIEDVFCIDSEVRHYIRKHA